ncbi:DUF3734 domain-containing protein, partial [Rhizobium johnstonii]
FSAKGVLPKDVFDVDARDKEIRFSSRTRLNTYQFRKLQSVRMAAKSLTEKLPPELNKSTWKMQRSVSKSLPPRMRCSGVLET